MARTRVITNPDQGFNLPPVTTSMGFGVLTGPGGNPQAGRQDRDLHRFNRKRGPRGTTERLPSTHGLGPLGQGRAGKFGASV